MDSTDSLGLVPYGFEPEYTASELEMLENNVTSDSECSEDGDWCVCENCVEIIAALPGRKRVLSF